MWLTGHSKGGAVATTAASRLLLGDSVVDSDLLDPAVRRHDPFIQQSDGRVAFDTGGSLKRLSVITFNAPMAFAKPLAESYDLVLAHVRGEHVRFEQKSDIIRKLPPGSDMAHVGEMQLEGARGIGGAFVLLVGVLRIGRVGLGLVTRK